MVLLAWQSDTNNPFGWGVAQARAVTAWVSDLSAGLDPQLEVIPAADDNAVAALPTAPIGVAPAGAAESAGSEGAGPGADDARKR